MKRILVILLLLAGSALAQQGNTTTIQFSGAPTGACSNIMVAINTATGDYYNCLSGAWNKIATGGGSPISGSGTNNVISKWTGTNTQGNSSCTDNASTMTCTEPIIGNSSQSAAAPAIGVTSNTGLYTDASGNLWVAVNGATANVAVETNRLDLLGTSSVLAFNLDSGISRDSAAAFDFGTTTAADKSGTLNAATANLTTAVKTPSIAGTTTNVASTIQSGVDANTTGATSSLTLRGENVTAGGSNNLAGGPLILAAGIGTGTSTPATVKIQSSALGLAAAATQNSLVTRYVTHVKAGSTTSATPTTLFNIASATNTAWGMEILVHVDLISSTPNVCGTTERFSLTGTNNNGAFGTVNIVAGTISTLCSTGTLTLAVSATAANPSVISVTPTWATIASITSATITVQIQNVSQQEIALL